MASAMSMRKIIQVEVDAVRAPGDLIPAIVAPR